MSSLLIKYYKSNQQKDTGATRDHKKTLIAGRRVAQGRELYPRFHPD